MVEQNEKGWERTASCPKPMGFAEKPGKAVPKASQSASWKLESRGAAPVGLRRERKISKLCGLIVLGLGLSIFVLTLLAAGALIALLARGPLNIDGLLPAVASGLDERFNGQYQFSLGAAHIVRDGYGAMLGIDGLAVKDRSGHTILSAPHAAVSLDPLQLIAGKILPRQLEIFDVMLHLSLQKDGSLTLSSGSEPASAAVITPPLALALASAEGNKRDPGLASSSQAIAPSHSELPTQDVTNKAPRALIVKQMAAALRLLIDDLTNPESPVASIDRVSIERGQLVIEDQTSEETVAFNDLKLGFNRTHGRTMFALEAVGPSGHFGAKGFASGLPGQARQLEMTLDDLSLDEITLALGQRNIGADFDMPLSAGLSIGLGADGALTKAKGHIKFGSGFFRLDDRDFEPMLIDAVECGFHWDASARQIMIEDLSFNAGITHIAVAGTITPPVHEGDGFAVNLASPAPNIFGPERPNEKPITISQFGFDAHLFLNDKTFAIDRLAFSGADFGFATAGTIDWNSGPRIRLGASVSPTPVRTAVRLWPAFIAAPIRAWFLAHFLDGTVEQGRLQVDLDAATLAAMRLDIPPPDDAVLIDLTISKGTIDFLPGAPPIKNLAGTGHVRGHTSFFNVTSGTLETEAGHMLNVSEGSFSVPDARVKPTPAIATAKFAGSVEAVGDLLEKDAFKPYAALPVAPSSLKGQIDGKLTVNLKFAPDASPPSVGVEINATASNFSADQLIGKERFDSGTLSISADAAGLKASGQGKMFGAPATLDIFKPKDRRGEAKIFLTFDEAARAKLGFNISGLSGQILAHAVVPLVDGEKPQAQVEFDLTHAGFDNILPGIVKPQGHAGRATFQIALNDDKISIDQIVLDASPIMAKGSVELSPDGEFNSAHFNSLKLSPGDDIKLDALRIGDSLKLIVRGGALDARPFLRKLVFSPPEADPVIAVANAAERRGSDSLKDLDLDLKVSLLTGYNKQILNSSELRLEKRGADLKQFSFSGRFGRDSIAGNLISAGGAPRLNLTSEDAGSLLSFIDVYKHMQRGRLVVGLDFSNDSLSGLLTIDDFILRDEPALRQLVAEGVSSQNPEAARKIDANSVLFKKLQVKFQRTGNRVDLTSGIMHGDLIGLTVDGWLDYLHDRVDMKGTFVPAYAFNNLFSQIPVFGALIGGGTNEGLIGVNFRLTGSVSSPTIAVNPLSAIAPGILRQIFGVGEGLDIGGTK